VEEQLVNALLALLRRRLVTLWLWQALFVLGGGRDSVRALSLYKLRWFDFRPLLAGLSDVNASVSWH
jgi:hypothetical protein